MVASRKQEMGKGRGYIVSNFHDMSYIIIWHFKIMCMIEFDKNKAKMKKEESIYRFKILMLKITFLFYALPNIL